MARAADTKIIASRLDVKTWLAEVPGGQVPVQIFMLTLPSQQVTMGVR